MAKAKKPVAKNNKSTTVVDPETGKPDVAAGPSKADQSAGTLDAKAEASKIDAKTSDLAKPEPGKTPSTDKTVPEKSAASAAASKTADTNKKATDQKGEVSKPSADTSKKITEPAKAETLRTTEAKEPARSERKELPQIPPAKTPEPAPQKQRSVFLPLVLGGVVAAGLGYLAAEMDAFGTRAPQEDLRPLITAQEALIDQQAERIATLEQAEVIFPEVDLSGIDEVSAKVDELATAVEGIDARLTDVEKRPIADGASEAAVAAYERELAKLQASVEEQRTEIEGMIDNALDVQDATAQAARSATLQSAIGEITAAINDGQPFADAVTTLSENGVDPVPAELTDAAQDGVATLNSLQSRFPDSARAALGAARASGEDGEEAGVGSFLRRQLGARSVAPRDGDDPDAVLSRAEAAVRAGEVPQALQELDTLPQAAKDAMQDWLADAQARQDAVAATKDLSQSLTAN